MEKGISIIAPTIEFRWFVVHKNRLSGKITKVLQQAWQDPTTGKITWEDIETVYEDQKDD